jgi:hypothetical protein
MPKTAVFFPFIATCSLIVRGVSLPNSGKLAPSSQERGGK